MAKRKQPETPAVVHSKANSENLQTPHRKEKKKKKIFWKKKVKHLAENLEKSPKKSPVLPPKTPQEVSSNWRALQELLKQEAAGLNSTAPEASSKKKHSAQEGGTPPKTPKINGKVQTVASKPAEQSNRTLAEALGCSAVTKSGKNVDRKNSPGTQEKGRERKRDPRRGNAKKKQGDIKHKRRKTEEPEEEPKPADIWFDDVDPDDIEAALGPEAGRIARKNLGIPEETPERLAERALVKEKAFEGLTRAVALDCEMVGVGPTGEDSIVARVSLVNLFGKCVYDKFVKPTEKVTDYRTSVSGVRPEHLKQGEDFKVVQKEVADILRGRILVGHALHNDLKILFLDHPKKKIRDTQRYRPFKQQVKVLVFPERKAVLEAAVRETVECEGPDLRAQFGPGRPGHNETVHHGEEKVGSVAERNIARGETRKKTYPEKTKAKRQRSRTADSSFQRCNLAQ